jgi:uncharacterized protein
VRLTTNLVGCEEEDLRVGLAVEVEFEHHEDVWLPLFHPVRTGGTAPVEGTAP